MSTTARLFSHPLRPGLALLLVVVAGAAWWAFADQGEPVSAQELADRAAVQLDEASDECLAGGIVYLRARTFVLDRRAAPPDLLAEGAFDYPDVVINESWATCRDDGSLRDYAGLLSTVDGVDLQRTRLEGGTRVFTDLATGKEQRFPRGGDEAGSVTGWLEAQVDVVGRYLDQGFEIVDRDAELDGNAAVELARQFELTDFGLGDGEAKPPPDDTYRRRLIISTDDPLIHASVLYRVTLDGELERVFEHRLLQWAVLPPGSSLGDRP